MALLRNVKLRNLSGGYARVFDDAQLGALISMVHSASVSSGNELEDMVADRVPNVPDLDAFLEQEIMKEGVALARKRQIKESQTLDFWGAEPDFMVFRRRQGNQSCHIIELKDGHVLDTKKASAERRTMHSFIEQNAYRINYALSTHFCSFNQNDREAVWRGFKKKIAKAECLTGRKFCALLEIDYDEIVQSRCTHGPENAESFLAELVKIDSVQEWLKKLLG